ncbi:MAG: TlpA disulfide reductase family protein [Pseudoxanthomonas sp.]
MGHPQFLGQISCPVLGPEQRHQAGGYHRMLVQLSYKLDQTLGKDMRIKKWLLPVLACLLAFAAHAAEPAVGDAAPIALGKDRGGDAVDLARYRGKIVVVSFWASWCGPCRRELPMLDALQKHVGNDFLQIIAVNEDEDLQNYRGILRQMKDFSLLLVRDTSKANAAANYGIKAYPNLWIIDPQGNVASHHVGYGEDSFDSIVAEIRQVMLREIEKQKATGAPVT